VHKMLNSRELRKLLDQLATDAESLRSSQRISTSKAATSITAYDATADSILGDEEFQGLDEILLNSKTYRRAYASFVNSTGIPKADQEQQGSTSSSSPSPAGTSTFSGHQKRRSSTIIWRFLKPKDNDSQANDEPLSIEELVKPTDQKLTAADIRRVRDELRGMTRLWQEISGMEYADKSYDGILQDKKKEADSKYWSIARTIGSWEHNGGLSDGEGETLMQISKVFKELEYEGYEGSQ
jgi:hypothetical protein